MNIIISSVIMQPFAMRLMQDVYHVHKTETDTFQCFVVSDNALKSPQNEWKVTGIQAGLGTNVNVPCGSHTKFSKTRGVSSSITKFAR